MTLSKSQYVRGLQCPKSLWLYKKQPELREVPDQQTTALFEAGNTAGDYAKQLFPDGIEIEFNPTDFDGMVKKTKQLIDEGVDTIYEATFKERGVFAMADILHKTQDGWNIYEVKSSTKVKPYHIEDASIQWHALASVLKLNRAYIVHINNQYIRSKKLNLDALFLVEDITGEVKEKQCEIAANINEMEDMLLGKMPEIDIGPHCCEPFECDFSGHCWKHIPEPSVFDLYRMSSTKKFALYEKGIIRYEDIPDDYDLSDTQYRQVDAFLNQEITINREIIDGFINKIKYPISFFDFETSQNVIPRFDNQRPYMQMPFQYSLHIVDNKNRMIHKEFLRDENSDPRRDLSEKMLLDLPKTGSIVAYNKSFEIGRIKELAELFPDMRGRLLALTDRFVDLIIPFRKAGYYHPDFNGSFSIKSVLPALFPDDPELDYKQLNIRDGGMAMDTFANLHLLSDPSIRDEIRKDLLAYCHLDTLAMVKIWQKLMSI